MFEMISSDVAADSTRFSNPWTPVVASAEYDDEDEYYDDDDVEVDDEESDDFDDEDGDYDD